MRDGLMPHAQFRAFIGALRCDAFAHRPELRLVTVPHIGTVARFMLTPVPLARAAFCFILFL
jgi:hypothetical protein